MKKMTFFVWVVFISIFMLNSLNAQDVVYPTEISTPVYFDVYGPISELPAITAEEYAEMEKDAFSPRNEDLKYRSYPYASTALPKGPDEVWQKQMGSTSGKAPILNFAGQGSPYYPPDANGDVGPNHYFQGVNSSYSIYNKTGGTVVSSTAYNTLFSGVTGANYNDGDPIILYDQQADRWMAAEFSISGSNDYMLVAVSTSGNPAGTWYRWSFDVDDMPDYMKFGIWRDGYYMATNTSSGDDVYVFQRDVMLTGGSSPQMIGFNNPWRPTTIDGFHCIQPLDNDGTFAPAGSPGLFITMNDDAIGGGSDQLWIYELTANWSSPSSSTFTRTQQLNVSAFDSNFGSNWDNIKQPGTSRELDAIPGVLMYRAQYRNFGASQHIVCCHTVDVDATDHAGIRWYELIKTGTTWSIRQQGTYAPDAHSRWMGSIAMNGNHEIGLGYSISSTSVYPGIRYCGQSASANASATGTLDVAEEIIWTGSYSQTSYNRWGDYSLLSVDPSDDHTFWFTTEYISNSSGSRATRIASFQFAAPPLNANFSGTPTTVCSGATVAFTDLSTGSPTTWSWSFPGGSPSSYNGENPPAITYSTPGSYNVSLTVGNGTTTDTETKTGYITVTSINADFSGTPTTVVVGNSVTFTDASSCGPTSWSWSFPGGSPSTYNGQNPPAITYNSVGSYNVSLTVTGPGGTDTETKTNYINVINCTYCPSTYSNTSDDWITNVTFNTINNTSGQGGSDSYEDFTAISTTVEKSSNYPISVTLYVGSTSWTQHCIVFFDWNQDCDFSDAGESYDLGQVSGSGTMNTTVSVPATALSGATRMRVAERYNQNPGPCDVATYGEVEDYTVVVVSSSPPSCTTPVAPSNGATNVSLNTTLSWNAATGATGYYLYFGTNNPPTNIVNGTNLGNVTSYTPNPALNTGTTYYWRIVPFNANGSATGCSVWSFTTGSAPSCSTPVNPVNGATGVLVNTTLSWSAVTGATGYYIYFGTNNPPTNIANGTNLGNVTSYTPPATLNYYTPYFWRIVPYNSFGSAVGCSVWQFVTEQALPPSCTTPVAPVNGATNVSLNTTLSWNASTGATGYYLYFGTNNPPTNIVNGTDLGNVTSYTPNPALNTGTTYYWRIVPYNTYGSASGCSVWNFTTGSPPSCTSASAPANGATAVSVNTTLSWNTAAGATGYYIYFGTNNPPTNIANGINLGNVTSYTPPSTLNYNTAYFWRIIPYNSFGSALGCSVWFFVTENGSPPACTTPISPSNGATGVSVSTSLSWNSASGASGYYLFFGTDDPPTNIVNGTDLGNTTSYVPASALNFNTDYFWQIVPYNAFGQATGCSVWNFTTGNVSYCIPTYSTGTSEGDYISLVQLGTINNSTGALSSPYYYYYSTLSTDIEPDQSYTLTVSAGTYSSGNNITAWIDYDHSGTFEESERLGLVTLGAMPQTGTMNFTVPSDAIPGTTRFRVREVWNTSSIDPCNNYTYGETEDYNVNILSTGLDLHVIAFLEGPYNPASGLMIPDLNPGQLPLSQPYNTAPWNYTGTESVASLPNLSIVDWILIELRDATDPANASGATMIARQAGFLLNDGKVVGMDGSSDLNFSVTLNNQLYVVIWHRNHLGIMSSTEVVQDAGVYTYNFSTSAAQVYGGTNGVKELEPGVWGMVGGDGDANGQVNNGDKNDVWTMEAGSSGYMSGDFNMDVQVNNGDKNDIWLPNSGKGGQVPDQAQGSTFKCWVPD